jgi:hypothetical protein
MSGCRCYHVNISGIDSGSDTNADLDTCIDSHAALEADPLKTVDICSFKNIFNKVNRIQTAVFFSSTVRCMSMKPMGTGYQNFDGDTN